MISIFMSDAALALNEGMSDLNGLIKSFDDPLMNSDELAFFLATHNYDAIPKDGHVDVNLNGKIYRLVPNGKNPGLADVIAGE